METLRTKYPLENRKPLKKTLSRVWSIFVIVFFFVVYILLITGGDSTLFFLRMWLVLILAALFILIFTGSYIYEIFYMKYYFYDLVGKTVVIKKGLFSVKEISLPFNRLQDVYIDQDVLDRVFGLYDVHVSSATWVSGELSHIDGLNKNNSEILKKLLLNSIHKNGEK